MTKFTLVTTRISQPTIAHGVIPDVDRVCVLMAKRGKGRNRMREVITFSQSRAAEELDKILEFIDKNRETNDPPVEAIVASSGIAELIFNQARKRT